MQETQQDSLQLDVFTASMFKKGQFFSPHMRLCIFKDLISHVSHTPPRVKSMKGGGSVGRFHIPSSLSACIAGREKLQATAKGNLNK